VIEASTYKSLKMQIFKINEYRCNGERMILLTIGFVVRDSKTEKQYQQQGKNAPHLLFFIGKPVHPGDFPESFP
jgi:hypothetical protein